MLQASFLVLVCSALLFVLACGEAAVPPARSAPQPWSEPPPGPAAVVSVPEPGREPDEAVADAGKDEEAPADLVASRLASFAGWYKGELMSTGEMVPAITRLRWKDGALTGEYSFGHELAEHGTLRDCSEPEPDIVRCEWRDEYGTGVVKLSFGSSIFYFDGEWSEESEPELWHPWTGVRTDGVGQAADDADSAGE